MPSAARIGDMHAGPTTLEDASRAIGPIVSGASTVLIDFMPAARVGDEAICNGKATEIAHGSGSVVIAGMPAARVGDTIENGGVIVVGCPSVVVGD